MKTAPETRPAQEKTTPTLAAIVSRGTADHYDRVLDLGAQMAAEGWYARIGLAWDRKTALERYRAYLGSPNTLFLVAQERGTVVGFLMAHLEAYLPFDDHYSAEHLVYVEPASRSSGAFEALLAGWESWAQERRARELYFAPSLSGDAGLFWRFLRARGWEKAGVAFRKALRTA